MNNENINKSITMVVKEVKDDLANIINNSQLPPCVIELILSNLLAEVKMVTEKQYEVDKSQYESYLASMENNAEVEKNTEDKFDESNDESNENNN